MGVLPLETLQQMSVAWTKKLALAVEDELGSGAWVPGQKMEPLVETTNYCLRMGIDVTYRGAEQQTDAFIMAKAHEVVESCKVCYQHRMEEEGKAPPSSFYYYADVPAGAVVGDDGLPAVHLWIGFHFV